MMLPLFCYFSVRNHKRKKIKPPSEPKEFQEPCARERDRRTTQFLAKLVCWCCATEDPDRRMLEQNLAEARARERAWPMSEVLELCEEVRMWDRQMNRFEHHDILAGL